MYRLESAIRPPTQKPPLGATLNLDYCGQHTDGQRLGDICAGYWLLNEGSGSLANDARGRTAGTLATSWLGRLGGAVRVSPSVTAISIPVGHPANTPMTVLWQHHLTGSTEYGFTTGWAWNTFFCHTYYAGQDGLYCGSDVATRFTPTTTLRPPQWPLYTDLMSCYTHNLTLGTFYVNGVLRAQQPQTAPVAHSGPLYSGSNGIGYLSLLIYFRAPLSAAAILAWYLEPYPAAMWTPLVSRRIYSLPSTGAIWLGGPLGSGVIGSSIVRPISPAYDPYGPIGASS